MSSMMCGMLLGAGVSGSKTYVDDCFSTYLYKGTGSSNHSILNGIDLAGKGGLVWTKNRDDDFYGHNLFDTARGVGQVLKSNASSSQSLESNTLTTFLNNGFKLNGDNIANESGDDFASWTFRKQKGFFDVVTWDGNGTAGRVISHSLGSVPGLITIKSTTDSTAWFTYHRDLGAEKYLILNETNAEADQTWFMNDTAPTSTGFSVGSSSNVNASGRSYVAYVFAGGESTATTARSLTFGGSYDSLQLASSSDFNFGTGDFTFEGWLKPNNNTDFQVFLNWGSDNPSIAISNDNNSFIYYNSTVNSKTAGIAAVGQWTHYAISRSSGTTRLFLNGELKNSFSDSHDYGAQALSIGAYINGNNSWNGSISNVRIVKGTAVYTSSFRVPTEPLTNITNTVLLCCNNSSTTGSTVTPGTITAENDVTASTDSPFDDPAGFVVGENEDQNVIKCGSYVGNGSSTGPEINLDWEPQWLIIKNTSTAKSWKLLDSMRGIVTGDMEAEMQVDNGNAEHTGADRVDLTSTGFKLKTTSPIYNGDGDTYIYLAIRRPDGYVGKPPELGTGVFAMAYGNSAGTNPSYVSNFPVDFALLRQPATTEAWYAANRLNQGKYIFTNTTTAENSASNFLFDHNNGWRDGSAATAYLSWMWKRHAGFDVVCYTGNGATQAQGGQTIKHSLSKTPEMIWLKYRNDTYDWQVYHKGLNGGTNPQNYKVQLNDTSAESGNAAWWNNTAPTSTAFTVGDSTRVNYNGGKYIAMLFASVDGISSVGSFVGNASSTGPVITTGFAPRFIIIKAASVGATNWFVYDTVRGLSSGNEERLELNTGGSQSSGDDITPSSTGFQIISSWDQLNDNNQTYIYYAHA